MRYKETIIYENRLEQDAIAMRRAGFFTADLLYSLRQYNKGCDIDIMPSWYRKGLDYLREHCDRTITYIRDKQKLGVKGKRMVIFEAHKILPLK